MIQLRRRTVALVAAAFLAVAALATVALVRTLAPAEAGAGFTDTPPWIATHAAWLAANDIASGYPDNTFRPNDNITRGQAAFWFGNYNNAIRVEKAEQAQTLDNKFALKATCPAGTRAVAGGGTSNSQNLFMTDSVAVDSDTAWSVRWETDNDVMASPDLSVYALCIPDPIPVG